MASFILAETFKKKSHKTFAIPLALITYILALIPFLQKSSVIDWLKSDAVFPYMVLPYTLGFPVLLLIVYWFRRKKINTQLEEEDSLSNKV